MSLYRKGIYITIILGYYAFVITFSLKAGFNDLVLTSLIIGGISYLWFLIPASMKGDMMFDFLDLMVNIFIYTFINSFVIFIGFVLSLQYNQEFTGLKLLMALAQIFIGVGIWTDYYLDKTKGLSYIKFKLKKTI